MNDQQPQDDAGKRLDAFELEDDPEGDFAEEHERTSFDDDAAEEGDDPAPASGESGASGDAGDEPTDRG
jgi:hypothetical protein